MDRNSQNWGLKQNHEIAGITNCEITKCGDPLYMLISDVFFKISDYNKCYVIVNTISADISWMQWYRQINSWYVDFNFVSVQLCYYLKSKLMAYLEVLLYILVLVNVVCPKVSNISYSNWCFLGHTWCYFNLRNH